MDFWRPNRRSNMQEHAGSNNCCSPHLLCGTTTSTASFPSSAWECSTEIESVLVPKLLLGNEDCRETETREHRIESTRGNAFRLASVVSLGGQTEATARKTASSLLRYLFAFILMMASTLPVIAADEAAVESSEKVVPPSISLFDAPKTSFAILTVAVCGTVIVFTELARRGRPFYVRPIAGLKAIEEAVGRSTEMGKPILFIPGIQDLNEIETVAGLTLLGRVARVAADYDTPMEVPTTRALVMTAAREAVQAAALAAGRPDYYNEDLIHYITDEQFGYVASVCGWMQREHPAACFYLGKFYAESLILSETGNSISAIQIAGTAETTQLPFFVAACDYTLLGEELFAASAYLSGEPAQMGMLKGQDVGKFAAIMLIVIGCGLATWDSLSPRGSQTDGTKLPPRTSWVTDTVLKGG